MRGRVRSPVDAAALAVAHVAEVALGSVLHQLAGSEQLPLDSGFRSGGGRIGVRQEPVSHAV
jgi:hypothetical protein